MSNKTRSVLKGIAVIIVLLAVLMHIGTVAIPAISVYRFWMVVISFGMLLIASK
jgi:uncharacterized protein YhdP